MGFFLDENSSSETAPQSGGGFFLDEAPSAVSSGAGDGYFKQLGSTLASPTGLGTDLYNGTVAPIKAAGSALYNAASDAMESGYGNPFAIFATPYHLVKNFYKDKTLPEAIYDTGEVASGFVPVVGPTLYNKAQQLVNPDLVPATTPEQDAHALRSNALGTVAALGVGKAISSIADSLPETANSLDRRSLSTRTSDYGSKSETRVIDTPDGEGSQSFLAASLNDLLENDKLGTSRDPSKLSKVIETKSKGLTNQIDTLISDYDKANPEPVQVSFDNALQKLYDGSIPGDLVDSYMSRLDTIDKNINAGNKDLSYIQKQKKALGKSYSGEDKVLASFNRAIYEDLKNAVEERIPEVGPLNQELAKYAVVDPIVERALRAKENASPASKMRDLGYTTGGIGGPAIVGTFLGGPVGTAVGTGIGLATRAAASPGGQAMLAKAARAIAPGLDSFGALFSPTTGSVAQAFDASKKQDVYSAANDEVQSMAHDLFGIPEANATEMVFGKPKADEAMMTQEPPKEDFTSKVKDIAKDLDADPDHLLAVMNFETGGTLDPAVKNKSGSGATGLIQFMPSTAKALTGASTKEAAVNLMASMSPTEQLDYVKKYLEPFKGKLKSLQDVYMAVLYPRAVGKDNDYALFKKGTTAYWQNRGLDINKDGVVTKAEATKKVSDFKR